MQAPMSSTSFRMMSMMLGIRNVFLRPRKVLRDAGLSSGDRVLDFGSGPGDYALAAAELVGPGGKVYALDIHPMAATRIAQRARALGLDNVVPITSSCQTDLEDESIDVVLLYYTLHLVEEKEAVLKELHRVLKPGGRLSFATRLESRARDSGAGGQWRGTAARGQNSSGPEREGGAVSSSDGSRGRRRWRRPGR